MRLLAAVLLLGFSAPLCAQEVGPDSSAEVQAYAPGMPFMALPVSAKLTSANASAIVLPLRSEAQLREAMQVADGDLRRADARLVRANESKSHVQGQAQQRRLELREIEKKKKDSKPSKADQKLLDAQQRAAERELRWAGQLEELGDAELDAAREARLVAQAKQQALDLELQLTQKRAARSSSGGDGLDVVIKELERQTLDAQRQYWKRAHELALTEEDLAEKRLDLYRSAVEKK